MKIDKLRTERQEGELEDELHLLKHQAFKAGGIDGGFSSQEELIDFLKVDD
jgi:hypothetical protein